MAIVISLIFAGVVLLYLVGWAMHLFHFHSKFKQCGAGFTAAVNYAEKEIYLRACRLAHQDTGMAMFWPLVVRRWNTDYVVEARQGRN